MVDGFALFSEGGECHRATVWPKKKKKKKRKKKKKVGFRCYRRRGRAIMWVQIVCGVVIYKLVRRFLLDDGDDFPDVDSGDSRLLFSVADRMEKSYGGKAYVGLRIPDAESGARQSIDVVLLTETEVIVVAVRNFSGFVEVGKDGRWVCIGERKHKTEVAEAMRQIEVLKSYFEQRGVTLPKGHLASRVVLPNPYCRVGQSINSVSEVITYNNWADFKPEARSGLTSWIKGAFRGGKGEDGIHQKLQFILSSTPMWDRLELRGDKIILGEFVEFKGKQEDTQVLKSLKRSKVSQLVVQKSSLFVALGRSKLQLFYVPRDYRSEGTSTLEWKEITVKASTEVLFQPLHSKRTLKCRLSKIVSLSLSA